MKIVLLISFLHAATALTSYRCNFSANVIPNQFLCQDDFKYIPLTKVCDGDGDCRPSRNYNRHYWILSSQDEDPHVCAKYFLRKTLKLSSETHPNGSLTISWEWRDGGSPSIYYLAGYYMIGRSAKHDFEATLSPEQNRYTPECMVSYTDYEISLWPFYKQQPEDMSRDQLRSHMSGYDHSRYFDLVRLGKIGKSSQFKVRTPALAPDAVPEILPLISENTQHYSPGQLVIRLRGPEMWGSQPSGFHLRWKMVGSEETVEEDIKLPWLERNQLKTNIDVNTTLSLKPGRQYIVYASARGIGSNGKVLEGPESSTAVTIPPLVPVDLVTEVVDPSMVILSWRIESPARSFAVTFMRRTSVQPKCIEGHKQAARVEASPFHGHERLKDHLRSRQKVSTTSTPARFASLGDGLISVREFQDSAETQESQWSSSCTVNESEDVSLQVEGSDKDSSTYTLPVFGLTPFSTYEVRVKACIASTCSQDMAFVFRTPPSELPRPIITAVLSNSTSSINLKWIYGLLQEDPELNVKFEVVVKTNASYHVIHTDGSSVTVTDLRSGTEYEVQVRASLEHVPGKKVYSPSSEATVSTRPIVPLAPTLSTAGFQTAPGVAAVFWEFENSTVTYGEITKDDVEWLRCGTSPECKIVVLNGSTPQWISGFATVTGLQPYTNYVLSVRGCNDHGCGDASTIVFKTAVWEPSEPTNLSLNTTEEGAMFLQWGAPTIPAGPLTGYIVLGECDEAGYLAETTTEDSIILSGLPSDANECTFTVSAYNVDSGGRQFRGQASKLKTSWPPVV